MRLAVESEAEALVLMGSIIKGLMLGVLLYSLKECLIFLAVILESHSQGWLCTIL